MNKNNFINYSEILSGSQSSLNLLLGNGFTIAYKKEFSKINEKDLMDDEELGKNILKKNENFKKRQEFFIKEQMKIKGKKSSLFISNRSKYILEEISKIHPDGICKMREDKLKACGEFLSPYLEKGNIFTLNYDLLLHWALTLNKSRYCDGFNKKATYGWCFNESENVNVYYCHGAINICSFKHRAYRNQYDYICFKYLKEQDDFIDQRTLAVVAKLSEEKEKLISKHPYLQSCYSKIQNLNGDLVIIGVSFNNDSHILRAIANSQKKNKIKVYYGLYNDYDKENIKKNFNHYNIKFIFFDSREINIWGN